MDKLAAALETLEKNFARGEVIREALRNKFLETVEAVGDRAEDATDAYTEMVRQNGVQDGLNAAIQELKAIIQGY